MPRAKANKNKATKPRRALEPQEELVDSVDEQTLVDRYFAMAEELNSRGSMELAVPFYRQAIALLLAEREQIKAIAGQEQLANTLEASTDVDGVMAAAASLDSASLRVDLLRQITALENELTEHNSHEIAAALDVLQEQFQTPCPQLLSLKARVFLYQGNLLEAHASYEKAFEVNPDCLRLRLNTAAARLANDNPTGALVLLRPLLADLVAVDQIDAVATLFSNLALAELAAGETDRLGMALRQWHENSPSSFIFSDWLEQARLTMESGRIDLSYTICCVLVDIATPERRREVLPVLAEVLEHTGDFREAALLYRELLRPELLS